jgi:hypothetical protein
MWELGAAGAAAKGGKAAGGGGGHVLDAVATFAGHLSNVGDVDWSKQVRR